MMVVDARARDQLQARLEQVLGEESAMTLMEFLPHGSPATSEDIRALRQEMNERFAFVERRFTSNDQHFTSIDQRFDSIDLVLDKISQQMALFEERFHHNDEQHRAMMERMDAQYQNVNDRLTNLDLRLDGFGTQVTGEMYREMAVQIRTYLFATMGSIVGVAGVVAAFT